MVDINKPFTMEDVDNFCATVKKMPKVPTKVRVGEGMWAEITRLAMRPTPIKGNKEYGYIEKVRATPVVLDKDLSLYEYEVDYD